MASDKQAQLQLIFRFQHDDLEANRAGRYSSRQRDFLKSKWGTALLYLGVGALLMVLPWLLLSGVAWYWALFFNLFGVVVFLSGIEHWSNARLCRKALHDESVATVRGNVHFAAEGHRQHAQDRPPESLLVVGQATFDLQARQYRELQGFRGQRVQVYYIPLMRYILSVEVL